MRKFQNCGCVPKSRTQNHPKIESNQKPRATKSRERKCGNFRERKIPQNLVKIPLFVYPTVLTVLVPLTEKKLKMEFEVSLNDPNPLHEIRNSPGG